MKLKQIAKHYNKLIFIAIITFAIVLVLPLLSSFSEESTNSAWDGVIARAFKSGTGTIDNPYIISNAGEFAYFKSLLEGEDASVYTNKNYEITNSFDYGNYDISINNEIPFSGNINGNGNTIYNITITNSLFNSLENATIENLNFDNIQATVSEDSGILSYSLENNNISSLILSGEITIDNEENDNITFAGLAYQDIESNLKNIVINLIVLDDSTNYYSILTNSSNTYIDNILVNSDYEYLIDGINQDNIYEFTINNGQIIIDNNIIEKLSLNNYEIAIIDNKFIIQKTDITEEIPETQPKAILRSTSISLHNTGIEGDTIYINDLTTDYDYYQAMDYTYFTSTGTIPDYTRLGIYNDNTLVKVYIKYSATDINNNYTGYVSNTEAYSNFIYYKYYVVENGYITIELIDNPFARRPDDKVFMGWITDYEDAEISIDMDTYIRYVKIPISDVSDIVNITMYAVWGNGKIYNMTSSATIYSTMGNFTTNMQTVTTTKQVKDYGNITDFSSYYVMEHISRNTNYPSGAYNQYGQSYSTRDRCNTNGGCDYYVQAGATYDENATYYILDSNTGASQLPYTLTTINLIDDGDSMSGYFTAKSVANGSSISGTYSNTGTIQSGNCTTNGGCTVYDLVQFYDTNGNANVYNSNSSITYYYLSTRDTNILVLQTSVTRETTGGNGPGGGNNNTSYHRNTVPLTITGINNGNNYIDNAIITISNAYISAQADLRIEYVTIASTSTGNANTNPVSSLSNGNIFGNYYNVKIGRGIENNSTTDRWGNTTEYLTAMGAYAGNVSTTGSSTSVTKYTFIVESGKYNALGATGAAVSSSSTLYVDGRATWGNDLDRINANNSDLDVYFSTAGNWGGILRSNSTGNSNNIAILQIVKSGTFGSSKADYDCGIYSGGRGTSGSSHYAARSAIVEGGEIYNLIGGPFTANTRANINDTYIYVKGGNIDMIIGGAGLSTTYGNRIVAVTGGIVRYGVFGGSNGSSSTGATNQTGEVYGSTFVYIGGSAYIGGGNATGLYGVTPGSVFGAGNGSSGYDQVGTVNNSNILINGGTITGNVYGGGNYGATGYALSSGTTTTNIKMLSGTVSGSIYGGGNNNGSGTSSIDSSININVLGGTVNTSIFGGSRTTGTIYGSTNITIANATISNSVYGGGEGGYVDSNNTGTYVRDNVDVIINSGTIGGSVYGGSAFGTVNAINQTTTTSSSTTSVTVNGGTITNSVFGGGQGGTVSGTTYTPQVVGNITVTINGGDISSVFGGNDQAGTHDKLNQVYLNGGIIENVYGGGNQSSVTTTNVYENGATVTNIYGGSNTLGNVTTSNVNINSGTVQNVYGGNNEGGSCTTTNVTVQGTATINGSVYGGGNEVATTTTNITLTSATGTIPNVYGGGNSASVTTSNITQNGTTVTNMFGGSNSTGTVTESNINFQSGTCTNLYGGNNAGGNTITSNITVTNGTITTTYGGGNQATSEESNITINGGTLTNIFGGGNSAGLDESNIIVTSGNIQNIYGGSNNSGNVDITNITITSTSGTITSVFGGGNQAEVGDTNITINSGSINNVYGGGNLAQTTGDTTVDINGGTINSNIYGGGNYGVVKGSSYVTITNATVLGSAYAGGNGSTATLEGDTNITIDGTSVIGTNTSVAPSSGCVFGGGNQAYTGTQNSNSTSNVNIVGGTIYGNVYGGANTSVIYGNTIVNIGKNAITSNDLIQSSIYIKGHIFGGGEANASGSEIYDWNFISVTQGVNINIDADTYNSFQIDGSFYGGGNASTASGDSYLLIRNYGSSNNPKENISIQRVTYVTIDNSSILLKGAIDRANDYDRELFSISRVEEFKLKNNSELFLETGANLLEKFESLDSSGNAAVVTIDTDNNTLTRTADNRIYMYEGKNLNIAKDQQVTDYGEVIGMTFLGMFNYASGSINTGIYSNQYDPGDLLDWSELFNKGSYVLGLHKTNHNIEVNGFYSNFINEDTLINEVKYIDPTPKDAQFYMWYIGENVLEYNINLVASKYSTLGSVELSFLEFSRPNTSFQILNFDDSEIANGVSLVDRNNIPRIANSESDANNIFGISMESSNNGWLTSGRTSFYTTNPNISGVTYYEGENSTVVPTMLFYLYHSKNLTEEKDLGTVRISIMAITKIDALTNEIERLVVSVNLSSALFQTTEYEGAMTPGEKYELFTSTSNNITNKSKISAYYALYDESNIYRTGYHRVLTSSFVLPEGTKITMLDYSLGTPKYYYHVIDSSDVSTAQTEYNNNNMRECSYNLSLFTKMGSLSSSSNYDDAAMNLVYYDGSASSEEFIFIVDFSDTTISQNQLNNTLLIEMRDSNNQTIIPLLGIQHSQLTYNIYVDLDSEIDITSTPSTNPLYIGYNDIFDVLIDYQNSTLSGVTITDTQYFDSKLGVQIYLKDSLGNVVSGTSLTGAYFEVDGTRYYPDISGYTHIKLANKVGNTRKWIIFNTENANIATGDYTFTFEAFASADGIYYSTSNPDYYVNNITIINSTYGLNPEIDDDSTIFSAINDKKLKFTIGYTSLLDNPNLRIALYRRKYDNVYDTDYELVDIGDYISDILSTTNNENEYLLTSNPTSSNRFIYNLESQLLTGTYRVAFRLYDDDTLIGELNRYIIVK